MVIRVQTFRVLAIIATVCYLAWFLLPFWAGHLTDVEAQVVRHSGDGALLPVRHPLYYWSWFILSLVAAVGMFLLQNWARHLYLALSILGPLSAAFSGFVIQAPLDTLFSNANLILDGVVLGVSYLSPFAENFKRA